MRALALDLGSKRIGIAVSSGTTATPYEVLHRTKDRQRDHRTILEHVAETEAEVLVLGLPLSLDGSAGPAARKALAEASELRKICPVPVVTWDERLSTVEAERSLVEMQMDAKARRKVVDMVAASVILQSWLDGHENVKDPSSE